MGWAFALPSAGAEGACPCVSVHLPDGSVQTLTTAQVNADSDVHDTQYQTRAVAGGATQDEPYVGQGLSIHHLLELVDADAVGFTETARPDGSWSTLTHADVASPSDFASGLMPAVRIDGDVVEYIRPLHDGNQDVNANDLLRSDQLDLYVHTGTLLTVTSTATSSGLSASFSARASGGPGPFAFTWDFGDGTSGSGAEVTHTYTSRGSYRVLVTASGPSDSAGSADPLVVAVGTPTASPSPTPGATASVPSSAPGLIQPGRPRPVTPGSPRPTLSPDRAPRPSASPAAAAAGRPNPSEGATPTGRVPRTGVPLIHGRVLSLAAPPTGTSGSRGTVTRGPAGGTGGPWEGVGIGLGVAALLGVGAARELTRAGVRS